jgi:hypothetical protein
MIRYRTERQGKPPLLFIGLSDENLTRLRAGMPIRIPADDPVARVATELVIYHGATEVELTRELEQHGVLPAGASDKAAEAIRERREYRHEGGER